MFKVVRGVARAVGKRAVSGITPSADEVLNNFKYFTLHLDSQI